MDPRSTRSRAAPALAVSVGYRLARHYPAGPDDCEAAAVWLVENARREFASDRLAIGGESAGAHLCAVTLVRLRDRHGATPFCGANLVYGIYDLTFTPTVRNWGERILVLSTPVIEWFSNHFVPDVSKRGAPDVSPLYADLRRLPPALFTIGTLDPLLDDSLFFALERRRQPRQLAVCRRVRLACSRRTASRRCGLRGGPTVRAACKRRTAPRRERIRRAPVRRDGIGSAPGQGERAFVQLKLRSILDGTRARAHLDRRPGRRSRDRVEGDGLPLRRARRRGVHGDPGLRADPHRERRRRRRPTVARREHALLDRPARRDPDQRDPAEDRRDQGSLGRGHHEGPDRGKVQQARGARERRHDPGPALRERRRQAPVDPPRVATSSGRSKIGA